MSIKKCCDWSAVGNADDELIGFGPGGSPLRSLRAKVGEKPKKEYDGPPDGFFDDGDDNGNGNGNSNLNSNANPQPVSEAPD